MRVYRPHLERALSHPLLLLLAWVAASYGAAGPSAVAEELLGPEKARSADERAASSGPLNAEEARQFWSFARSFERTRLQSRTQRGCNGGSMTLSSRRLKRTGFRRPRRPIAAR